MLKFFFMLSIMLNAYFAMKLQTANKTITFQDEMIGESDYYFAKLNKENSINEVETIEEVINPENNLEDSVSSSLASTKKPDLRSGENVDYEHYDISIQSNEEEMNKRILDFFNYELSLNEKQVEKYFKFKNELKTKSASIFTPPENFKEGEPYVFNQEEDFKYKELLMSQLEKLKETMGTNKYKAYQKFKNSYNKKVYKQAQYGQPVYIMEF